MKIVFMTCLHFARLTEARDQWCGRLGALVVFFAARVQEIMWIMEHVHWCDCVSIMRGMRSLVVVVGNWMAARVFTHVDPENTCSYDPLHVR